MGRLNRISRKIGNTIVHGARWVHKQIEDHPWLSAAAAAALEYAGKAKGNSYIEGAGSLLGLISQRKKEEPKVIERVIIKEPVQPIPEKHEPIKAPEQIKNIAEEQEKQREERRSRVSR
jgi:hypothetical protein